MLADIDKETVDFGPNYDGKEQEPLVLPARAAEPAGQRLVRHRGRHGDQHPAAQPQRGGRRLPAPAEATRRRRIDELIEIDSGARFPDRRNHLRHRTACARAIAPAAARVVMRAKAHFEDIDKGTRQAIIVDELPYQVNKTHAARAHRRAGQREEARGHLPTSATNRDKSGMRVVIELKRGEVPEVVLNNLYKQTQLQDTFGINMVALVDGQPRVLNLKQMLDAFLSHRREVVTRRTVFELREARERGHVLEGLAVALANIDEFIALIKAAPTPPVAKTAIDEPRLGFVGRARDADALGVDDHECLSPRGDWIRASA